MSISRLSVVDTGWPGHVPELVPALEQLGYHRYWTTEHYNPSQSSSPTVLAGLAAQMTSRIRIGTAGVLLSLTPPLRVVNDFAVLELLHPGRIDMGVAGAAGGELVVDAMRDGTPLTPDTYTDRVRELATLQRLPTWHNGDARANVIGPASPSVTPMWVCGTGRVSAQLAGELGTGYAFHDQLRPPSTNGPEIVQIYRDSFRPSAFRSRPELVVATLGAVADTEQDAKRSLAGLGLNRSSFCGSVDQVQEQLNKHAADYGVDELAIFNAAHSLADQLAGYGAIARAFGLVTGSSAALTGRANGLEQ